MNNTSDVVTLLRFYSLESDARWAMCRALGNKGYLIRQRSGAKDRSPLLFAADISVTLSTPMLELKNPDEGQVLPELSALLQAMIHLHPTFGYIWGAHFENRIFGPGTFLWRTVERLSRQCLSNTVWSQETPLSDDLPRLFSKMMVEYRKEIKFESQNDRAYKAHVRSLKKKRRKV